VRGSICTFSHVNLTPQSDSQHHLCDKLQTFKAALVPVCEKERQKKQDEKQDQINMEDSSLATQTINSPLAFFLHHNRFQFSSQMRRRIRLVSKLRLSLVRTVTMPQHNKRKGGNQTQSSCLFVEMFVECCG
jgi:hypothetical protein